MRKMQKSIAIVGPTAVGKSALAVTLARHFGGEVISADSRQVYKELDIGTGKITKKEMRGVPHHLLDVANPQKRFSVAEYQTLARRKIEEILSRGKVPIICGGTGLYADSVLKEVRFPKVPPNPALRRRLEIKPAVELCAILKKLDPRRAKTVDPRNPRRLIRAIEIASVLGHVQKRGALFGKGAPWDSVLWLGLTLPPEELKERIRTRLLARVEKQGMIQEVKRLHAHGLSWKRMEELGLEYRYISRYLRGLLSREEVFAKLQTEIWRYAKRQMTWFRRNKAMRWFNPTERRSIEKTVREFLAA